MVDGDKYDDYTSPSNPAVQTPLLMLSFDLKNQVADDDMTNGTFIVIYVSLICNLLSLVLLSRLVVAFENDDE